mmetsp:Transcript_13015/g.21278  ORF Transcript_13015/g.21278 Transcript_13015/m.21278 type:complete len:210 (+) Transcript_13015:1178-1807(+)
MIGHLVEVGTSEGALIAQRWKNIQKVTERVQEREGPGRERVTLHGAKSGRVVTSHQTFLLGQQAAHVSPIGTLLVVGNLLSHPSILGVKEGTEFRGDIARTINLTKHIVVVIEYRLRGEGGLQITRSKHLFIIITLLIRLDIQLGKVRDVVTRWSVGGLSSPIRGCGGTGSSFNKSWRMAIPIKSHYFLFCSNKLTQNSQRNSKHKHLR